MNRFLCVHGHFYQPPRENPWLEEVELQDSAYPYHDWNERITAECYATNAAARILDQDHYIRDLVNNYSRISFNFGPTLLAWMEQRAPEVYQAIIEADHESRRRFSGHGSALAQAYNHLIMPLANSRDKRTQVVWGMRDFEHRFGRRPAGMWLPETAVDLETLDILVDHGVAFTILAPRQARRARRIGSKNWLDVSGSRIDPRRGYLCRLPSGRSLTLFFYDGPVSQDIAFNGLLNNGEALARRWIDAFTNADEPQLVHMATDGETYGHHHRFGEMALAYALDHVEARRLAQLTVYGEFLDRHPPLREVEIIENTSWSCVHGVERWRNDCGCNSGRAGWRQQWRAPLREAMNLLRDRLAEVYEQELGPLLPNPWLARDDYIAVILDRSPENVERFLARHAGRELESEEKIKALRLLEMQRHSMLMFTSCGWFFDEISGLETTQALGYAARAIQLAEKASGATLEPAFRLLLEHAPSNLPEYGDGARVYDKLVKPMMIDLMRVGAHYAVSSLFEDYQETTSINCYTAEREFYERKEAGRQKLAIGRARMRSDITWAEEAISFAVLHLGDHSLMGGVRKFLGEEAFETMRQQISEAFSRSDLPEIIRLMDRHFETHNYSLWHLFRDEQRRIFDRILASTLEGVEASFRQIYDHSYPIMQAMRELGIPLPTALLTPAEHALNANLRRLLEAEVPDLDQLRNLLDEVHKWGLGAEKAAIGFAASSRLTGMMERLRRDPHDQSLLSTIETMLQILQAAAIELDLMKAQQLFFHLARQHYQAKLKQAEGGDQSAQEWVKSFATLGDILRVRSG
jgi:alpha-amylase/alpha-mannosidase (GH57 family)